PNWSTGTWKSPVERAVKEWAPHDVARCFALFSRGVLTPSKQKLASALIWGERSQTQQGAPSAGFGKWIAIRPYQTSRRLSRGQDRMSVTTDFGWQHARRRRRSRSKFRYAGGLGHHSQRP